MGVPGWDLDFAPQEHYDRASSHLFTNLEALQIPGLIYGSFARGNPKYGKSDIDGLLILPQEFVSNKELLRDLSRVYNESLMGFESVPLQFSVTDRGVLRDGRFSTFGKSFLKHFIGEGKQFGLNPFPHIYLGEYEEYKHEMPSRTGHNLAKIRQRLLIWDFVERTDASALRHNTKASLDQVLRSPSEIRNYFQRGNENYESERASDEVIEWLTKRNAELDVDEIMRIKEVVNSLSGLKRLYSSEDRMRNFVERGLTQMEGLIRWYCSLPTVTKTIEVKEVEDPLE